MILVDIDTSARINLIHGRLGSRIDGGANLALDLMPRQSCCSSPASIRYWFFVSLVSWLAISAVGIYWHPVRFRSAAAILFALTAGCFANWFRNRTLHCAITGPLFLIAGLLSLLSELSIIRFPDHLLWPILSCGVAIAFFIEWRCGSSLQTPVDPTTPKAT